MNQRKLDILQIQAEQWARGLVEKFMSNMLGERENYALERRSRKGLHPPENGQVGVQAEEEEADSQEAGAGMVPG